MFRWFLALLVAGAMPAWLNAEAPAPAPSATAEASWLRPGAIDVRAILPPPPAPESPAGQADLETVLQVQAARTPAQIAWAKAVEADNVFANAPVLGAWFTAEHLPATATFFAKLEAEYNGLGVKKLFGRPRPPVADPRVQPCVGFSKSSSYPSGHALRAWLWAELLATIYPEARGALAERARAVAWARVIGGVHYPSDTAAGRQLAQALAAELLKNPAVRAALDQCRAEAAPWLLKRAA